MKLFLKNIPNDVVLIIYRLLHNDIIKRLHQEYHAKVLYYGNGYAGIFYNSFKYMYRVPEVRSSTSISIYNIKSSIVSQLPQKYWYTSGCNRPNGYFSIEL